jgi:glyoxylase-like metal-dependent hydrolase (beta-lactamase superfamily II)
LQKIHYKGGVQPLELIWSNAALEVHRTVVGPVDNNVYIVRCRRTGEAALIDAANEHDLLLPIMASLGVRQVLETHGHWDHIGAVAAAREAGYPVYVREEDAADLPSYDALLDDDDVLCVGDVRIRTHHTPGHTPGSMSFSVIDTPLLFTGDTLFPGGPGATSFPGGDFTTILTSITERIFRPFSPETVLWPGHGAPSTLGAESPHFDEWVARGW